MKKYYIVLMGMLLLLFFCSPHRINLKYGDRVNYGEGRHPGIDYEIPTGTPIIAAANGFVSWIGDLENKAYGEVIRLFGFATEITFIQYIRI